MLFNPTNLDQVYVQVQYLKEDGKIRRQYDESKKASNSKGGQEKGKSQDKGKGKKETKTTNIAKKEGGSRHCSHCDKDDHVDAKCWKSHSKLRPYKNKNKEKTNAMVLRCDDIKGISYVDEKVNCSTIQKVEEPQNIEE